MTSGKIKPWQIVLFIAAVGALGWSLWSVLAARGVDLADEVVVVDVATGDLYRVPTERLAIPAKSPLTGQRTLFRVEPDEEGSGWVASPRTIESIRAFVGSSQYVDLESGRVSASGTPKKYVRPE